MKIFIIMYINLFINNVISIFLRLCVFNFVMIGVIKVKFDFK